MHFTIPETLSYLVKESKFITFIVPYEPNVFVDFRHSVKVTTLTLEDYADFTETNYFDEETSKETLFFDIVQIRDCRLSEVSRKEWYYHCGPPNGQQWKSMFPAKYSRNSDPIVKVLVVKPINYSLKSLNRLITQENC